MLYRVGILSRVKDAPVEGRCHEVTLPLDFSHFAQKIKVDRNTETGGTLVSMPRFSSLHMTAMKGEFGGYPRQA